MKEWVLNFEAAARRCKISAGDKIFCHLSCCAAAFGSVSSILPKD